MKSVLPPELEAKRQQVVRESRQGIYVLFAAVCGVLFGLIGLMHLAAQVIPREYIHPVTIGCLGFVLLPCEAYAIYRFSKRCDATCRRLGFVCPHCGKPLFQSRGMVHLTGRCPKCGKGVTAQAEREDQRERLRKLPAQRNSSAMHPEQMLGVGTRIQFLTAVNLAATDDHPEIYYAEAGEEGEITGYADKDCYWVNTDQHPRSFAAWPDEFEVLSSMPTKLA